MTGPGSSQGFYKGRVEGSVVYVPKKSDFDGGLGANPILYPRIFASPDDAAARSTLSRMVRRGLRRVHVDRLSSRRMARSAWVRRHCTGPTACSISRCLSKPCSRPTSRSSSADQRETLYGRAWLLTHFLIMEQPRKGQLTAYVQAISKGQPVARSRARDASATSRNWTRTSNPI